MRENSCLASTQAVKLTRLTGLAQTELRNAVGYKLHNTPQSKILEFQIKLHRPSFSGRGELIARPKQGVTNPGRSVAVSPKVSGS